MLAVEADDVDKERKLLGRVMKFKNASEPTDIIWENRHFVKSETRSREFIAFLIIGFLLFLSFLFIFKVSRLSSSIAKTFPAVSCEAINNNYGTQLQKFAIEDYDFIEANPGIASSGALKCFCTAELKNDLQKALYDTYGHPNGKTICWDYQYKVLEVFVWLNSLKYFITGVNFVLRTVCIALVAWIGYKTETIKLLETTKVTFVVQFFNTGFLLLLVNCNLSEQKFDFGLNGGAYSDFDDDWFLVIGNTLVSTLIFTSVFPVMEAFGFWGMRLGFRILDKRRIFSCDKYVTTSTSIQSYVQTYSGPVYSMHFKYAGLLNIVFITFLYGFGIPILFPVSAFAILVLYLTEKTMLYYAY